VTRRRLTPLEFGLYVCVPALFTLISIAIYRSIGSFAGDFHEEFWPAALRLLHGQSPYLLTQAQIAKGVAFPYPALAAVLFAPFALLSRGLSDALFTILSLLALLATLRVLDVRDWRVLGLALLWAPVVNAWQSANLTLVLGLGIALLWRYRERPALNGAIAAIVVSLKPFVWPVALWLLATRRYRAAGWMLVWGLLLNAVAWSVVGWNQIGRYLHDASSVSGVFFRHAYTPVALVLHLGVSPTSAEVIGVLVALVGVFACLRFGRRREDLPAFTLAVVVMWLASPVLWMHYFALALVPLALARPRVEAAWAAPIVLIVCGSRSTAVWQILLTFLAMGAVVMAALRGPATKGSTGADISVRRFNQAPLRGAA
jgi:hypothetical protein